MKKIFFFFSFLFVFLISFGQSKINQNSLLWEISGNGLKQPSYIFGTIHIIPEDDFFFFDKWKDKLLSCKNLVLEVDINMNIFKQLSLIKEMKLPKDSSLFNYMDNNEQKAYQSYMIDSLDVSESIYKASMLYKPFFTYSMILNDIIPGKKKFYEKYFSEIAKKNKMKIIGLETIDFQMSLVVDIPIQKQIDLFLFDYGKAKQEDIKSDFYQMVSYYKTQNLDKIAVLDDNPEEQEFNEEFIYKRNRDWISKIIGLIEKKSTFVAVGAGHLPGNTGVIELLRKEGFTLNPVSCN